MKKEKAVLNCFMFFIGVFLLVAGCKSGSILSTNFKRANLFGMVYDLDNKPCTEAVITVDGKDGPITDINGRFVINKLANGEHTIEVRKDGYEDLTLTYNFFDKSHILYIRVISLNQLLKKLEEVLEQKKHAESLALIQRAEAINKDNPVLLYLKAVYYLNIDSPEEALNTLTALIDTGFENFTVYLTMADIYEKWFSDIEQARRYLEKCLTLKDDPMVRFRLSQIEGE
jgi:tetratricopeptide (TPR) repeat protein